jgi:hypothetical protein
MSPDARIEAMLMQFPGPITLYPSRRKWALILVSCGLFTVSGIWMVERETPMGWPVLVFFLLGAIVAATALLPGAGGLTLDSRGFEIKNLFRRDRLSWQGVTDFEVGVIPPAGIKSSVIFDYIDAKDRAISKLATAIAGRNGALPDTYGFSADDLAYLMMRWRERAMAPGPAPQAETNQKLE